MTCIVALKTQTGVMVGSDSLLTHPSGGYLMNCPKWVEFTDTEGKVMIIGAGGILRDLQIVEAFAEEWDGKLSPLEVMKNRLLPHIRRAVPLSNGVMLSHFLIAYRGEIFEISSNHALMTTIRDYAAIGNGGPWAMGSLASTGGWDSAEKRVYQALYVAEQFCQSVRAPMYVREVTL